MFQKFASHHLSLHDYLGKFPQVDHCRKYLKESQPDDAEADDTVNVTLESGDDEEKLLLIRGVEVALHRRTVLRVWRKREGLGRKSVQYF